MRHCEEENLMSVLLGNILRGVGSVASIFPPGGEPIRVAMPTRSEEQAFTKDWENISRDFKKAVEKVADERKEKTL